MNKSTRGSGLLEGLLAKKRHALAKKKISGRFLKGRILDIGCGVYPAFLKQMENFERHGIDRECFSAPEWLNFISCDLDRTTALPFDDGYFDVVSALALIEHLNTDTVYSLMREMHRALKDDGAIVITTPAYWTDKILRMMAVLNLVSRQEIEEHKSQFSQRRLRDMLSKAGFSDIKTGSFEFGLNLFAVATK